MYNMDHQSIKVSGIVNNSICDACKKEFSNITFPFTISHKYYEDGTVNITTSYLRKRCPNSECHLNIFVQLYLIN